MKKRAICLVVLAFFQFLPVGAGKEAHHYTYAVADAHVDEYNPSSNYGGSDWLIVGQEFLSTCEVYLAFDVSDAPSSWEKAELEVYLYYVDETFSISVSVVSGGWSELGITWNNRPGRLSPFASFTVYRSGAYAVDVSEQVNHGSFVSFCVYSVSQSGYAQGDSRESPIYFAPRIKWTYQQEVWDEYLILVGVILVGVGFVSVLVVLYAILSGRRKSVPPTATHAR